MNDTIRGILFDIGGVLVTLGGAPSLSKLLGIENSHEAVHVLWAASPAAVAYETGRMSATDFAAGVVADLNLPISPAAFLEDFRTWPGRVKSGAFELLDAIPQRYRVAALSNTNAVHWDRITALGLAGRFERTYLSHELGCLKPADEPFLLALKDMALSPSEVVFLDDVAKNVDAARALGIRAHQARDPQEAWRVLEEYGVVSARA